MIGYIRILCTYSSFTSSKNIQLVKFVQSNACRLYGFSLVFLQLKLICPLLFKICIKKYHQTAFSFFREINVDSAKIFKVSKNQVRKEKIYFLHVFEGRKSYF